MNNKNLAINDLLSIKNDIYIESGRIYKIDALQSLLKLPEEITHEDTLFLVRLIENKLRKRRIPPDSIFIEEDKIIIAWEPKECSVVNSSEQYLSHLLDFAEFLDALPIEGLRFAYDTLVNIIDVTDEIDMLKINFEKPSFCANLFNLRDERLGMIHIFDNFNKSSVVKVETITNLNKQDEQLQQKLEILNEV